MYKPAWWRRWAVTTFYGDFSHSRIGPFFPFKWLAEIYANDNPQLIVIKCKELDILIEIEKRTNNKND